MLADMTFSDLRHIDCLRVAVTDPCNRGCSSCADHTHVKEPKRWLDHHETTHLVGLLSRLGVSRVRLTGGEPLLRRGLVDLVTDLAALPGVDDLSLSTTGGRLAYHARDLRSAGLTDLSVSVHSLNPDCFAHLSGRDGTRRIREGLLAAKHAGFASMITNIVLLAGRNPGQVESLADFVLGEGLALRLIEPMPPGSAERSGSHPDLPSLVERLVAEHRLLPCGDTDDGLAASDWIDPTSGASLEVMSYRLPRADRRPSPQVLTADGNLCRRGERAACVQLGAMLRAGTDDASLTSAIVRQFAAGTGREVRKAAPRSSTFNFVM